MNVNIISYSPGPCEINPQFRDLSKRTEMTVEATPQLRYSKKF